MWPTALDNPILNSPYEPPEQHFVIGHDGPTGEVKRRPPAERVVHPGARRTQGSARRATPSRAAGLRLRRHRRAARGQHADQRHPPPASSCGGPAATPASRRSAASCCSTGPTRPARTGCCSASGRRPRRRSTSPRSPAATASPTSAAGSTPRTPRTTTGCPRVGLKMATGTGKTVVMAMLIAWQVANKAFSPRDARFTNRFLVVTPGITIRDRLRVLLPGRRAELLRPARTSSRPTCGRRCDTASIVDHQLPRVPAADGQGGRRASPRNTRKLLRGRQEGRPVRRDRRADRRPGAARPRRARQGRDRRPQRRGPPLLPGQAARATRPIDAEAKERNEGARVWFRGLQAVAKRGRRQGDLRPVGDARSTSAAPATRRATSSRGWSATSR